MKSASILFCSIFVFATSLQPEVCKAGDNPCPTLLKKIIERYSVSNADVEKIGPRYDRKIGSEAAADKLKLEALETDFLMKKISKEQFNKESDAILMEGFIFRYPQVRPSDADIYVERFAVRFGVKYQIPFGGGEFANGYPFTEELYKERGSDMRLLFNEQEDLVGIVVADRKKNQVTFLPINKDCSIDSGSATSSPLSEIKAFEQQKKLEIALAAADTTKAKIVEKADSAVLKPVIVPAKKKRVKVKRVF